MVQETTQPGPQNPERKARLLLVDDNEQIRSIIKRYCRSLEDTLTIVEAETCDDGLKLLGKDKFDAVLTDFSTGGDTTGNDVAKWAAELKIPCIIMTGEHGDDVDSGLLYTKKPLNPKVITAWISERVKLATKQVTQVPDPFEEGPYGRL